MVSLQLNQAVPTLRPPLASTELLKGKITLYSAMHAELINKLMPPRPHLDQNDSYERV